jgi:hypothetical protein
MSDANRFALAVVEEVTPGTTPPTPAWEALRITGAPSLEFAPTTVSSEEIRPDRNIPDLILTDAEAGGEVSAELSFGAQDTILEGAMYSAWTERNNRQGADITDITGQVITVNTGTAFVVQDLIYLEGFGDANDEIVFPAIATSDATTITAASGLTANASPGAAARVYNVGVQGAAGDIDSTVSPDTLTSTILDFTTLGLLVGDWMKIGGTLAANQLPTAENNDWVRISAIAANILTFDVVPTGWAADASTTELVWLFFGDRLRNGTTKRSYSLEEQFQDHSPINFQYFRGMHLDTFGIAIPSAAIMTASMNWLGFTADPTPTRFTGSTDVAAPQNAVLNTSSNVGRIGRGVDGPFTTLDGCVFDGAINFANNLRQQKCVGVLGAAGIGSGSMLVTGNTNCYFDSISYLLDVINNTERSLDMRVQDSNGKAILFDMPRLKYSTGGAPVPSQNSDIFINLEFQAILESANDLYTVQIQRFHKVQ